MTRMNEALTWLSVCAIAVFSTACGGSSSPCTTATSETCSGSGGGASWTLGTDANGRLFGTLTCNGQTFECWRDADDGDISVDPGSGTMTCHPPAPFVGSGPFGCAED